MILALLGVVGLAVVAGVLFVAAANWAVIRGTGERIHTDLATVPARECALVLGTSRYLANGRPNPYFTHRMNAAAALFEAGKVNRLLLSGGSDGKSYNEAVMMRDALVERGVPADVLILDDRGYRTLDSILRSQTEFGETDVLVVSQTFHNQRALYLARAWNFEMEAFAARDVKGWAGARVRVREVLAKCLAFLDVHLLHRPPRRGDRNGTPSGA